MQMQRRRDELRSSLVYRQIPDTVMLDQCFRCHIEVVLVVVIHFYWSKSNQSTVASFLYQQSSEDHMINREVSGRYEVKLTSSFLPIAISFGPYRKTNNIIETFDID